MKWLGLLIGAALGAAIGKFEAALTLAILGFVGGFVIDLVRASTAKDALNARIEKLEKAMATMSRRLEAVETSRSMQPSPPVQTSREADASDALARTGERPMPMQPLVTPAKAGAQGIASQPDVPPEARLVARILDPRLRGDDIADYCRL